MSLQRTVSPVKRLWPSSTLLTDSMQGHAPSTIIISEGAVLTCRAEEMQQPSQHCWQRSSGRALGRRLQGHREQPAGQPSPAPCTVQACSVRATNRRVLPSHVPQSASCTRSEVHRSCSAATRAWRWSDDCCCAGSCIVNVMQGLYTVSKPRVLLSSSQRCLSSSEIRGRWCRVHQVWRQHHRRLGKHRCRASCSWRPFSLT